MTLSDYLIDVTLIGLVLFQVRGRRLTTKSLLLPLGIVAYVATEYLRGIPTAHNDLVLIAGLALVGATLGGLAGACTAVTRAPDGSIIARAGVAAAGLWILGTGGRLAFQLYASHGGGPSITHLSTSIGVTSAETWTAALILMAISEVVMRTTVLAWRSHSLGLGSPFGLARTSPAPTETPVPAESVSPRPLRSRTPVASPSRSMMESGDRPH